MNAAALALGALLLAASAGAAPADRREELERLRRSIEESRERVSRYERDGRGLLEAIDALDRSAASLAGAAAGARERAAEARAQLAAIGARSAELRAQLAETRRAMSARAVGLYKAGEAGALQVLFAAESLREFLARVQALRLLLAHDSRLLARHRAQGQALALAEEATRQAAGREAEALDRLGERLAQLHAERERRQQLVARVFADRARERDALIELETAARALEETLESLREAPDAFPRAGPAFASLRAALEAPVAAEIARPFGRVVDAEFRTETFRKGVEFDAPLGSLVQAVAAGVVRFAGWFSGYGKLVILDHGDEYFTVSGHLEEIEVEVGARVAARDALGRVGETGSLSGPKLYFEIRHGGEPLDPAEWLRSDRPR